MKKKKQAMFVCTGNTCRSPMAKYLFEELCEREGLSMKSISRGVYVSRDSRQAQPDAIESVQRIYPNSTIADHVPTQLSLYDIVKSDLILTMEEAHVEILLEMAFDTYCAMHEDDKTEDELEKELGILGRSIMEKTLTLKGANNNPDLDVSDPYDGILTPVYKAYSSIVDKIKDKGVRKKVRKLDKVFDKVKFLPDFGPFRAYRQKVYDNCRDEILENLELLVQKLKPSHGKGGKS